MKKKKAKPKLPKVKVWICDECGKHYSLKYNLKRHISTAHEKKKTYSCKFCGKHFLRRDAVKRHIIVTHTDSTKVQCEICQKWLKNKGNLKTHLLTHQPGKKRTYKKRKYVPKLGNYECNDCSTKFLYRQNLVRHIQVKHINPQIMECPKCGLFYKSKYSLNAHIREVHESDEKLTCDKCCKHFYSKRSMENHVMICSKRPKVNKVAPSIICIECEVPFPRHYLLLKHYEDEHGIELKYEDKEFANYDAFLDWKRELEYSTIAVYHSSAGLNETVAFRIRKYRCHRSGTYRSRCENDSRRRQLKKKGSKKLNGTCPAGIVVKESKADGKCEVSFQTTHVGHEIGTQTELSHIYLDKMKRLELAAKMIDRIPLTVIMENENEALIKGNHDNRKRALTPKDLYNIKIRYAPSLTSLKRESDDITTFIDQNRDNILYFVNGTSDVSITTLKMASFSFEPHDFVMVFMSPEQKKNIEALAENRVVSIYVNEVLNSPEKFYLHTVMVLNWNQEGLPVAFLLTNREDDLVCTCFLECIKGQVGELKMKTLITGMQTAYFELWTKVMSAPQYQLYCTTQVTQEWDRQCKKIPQPKRGEFRSDLDKIHKELDEDRFRITLDDFVNQTDPDYRTFLEFFKANFLNNTEHWAYCYRKFAEVDTNTDLHFKCNVLEGKKVKTLASCLDSMKSYLSYAYRQEEVKKVDGYTPLKLQILNSRHISSIEQMNDFTIYCLDEPDTWQVISVDSIYTVSRQEPQCRSECLLKCFECNNVCLHEYRCSCMDYSVKFNMCEHIHTVLMIYTIAPSEEKEEKKMFTETFATVNPPPPPESITVSNPASPVNFVDEDDLNQHNLSKAEILEELRQKFRSIEESLETDPSQWTCVKEILDAIPTKINDITMSS